MTTRLHLFILFLLVALPLQFFEVGGDAIHFLGRIAHRSRRLVGFLHRGIGSLERFLRGSLGALGRSLRASGGGFGAFRVLFVGRGTTGKA